jgi:hypothetical protein
MKDYNRTHTIFNKYQYVGQKKVFVISRNDLLILDALMHDGSQQKYSHHKYLRYSEHGGLLDFDKHGLERIIVTTRKETDKTDKEIFFPIVPQDADDFEFMYHTHPPTPTPGARAKVGVVYEIPSLPDIQTFILAYQEGLIQGSIIVAPEGFYVIRALKNNLQSEKYDLEKMHDEILYLNYKYAKKYKFHITPETFYKKIITDTKVPTKLRQLIKKYTNNEITIDFFKRKKDSSGNWTIKKLILIVNPKEKK